MATSKREEGRDRAEDGTGGRGRGAETEGPEREGERREGEGPHDPLAWGPQCLNPALVILEAVECLVSSE